MVEILILSLILGVAGFVVGTMNCDRAKGDFEAEKAMYEAKIMKLKSDYIKLATFCSREMTDEKILEFDHIARHTSNVFFCSDQAKQKCTFCNTFTTTHTSDPAPVRTDHTSKPSSDTDTGAG